MATGETVKNTATGDTPSLMRTTTMDNSWMAIDLVKENTSGPMAVCTKANGSGIK